MQRQQVFNFSQLKSKCVLFLKVLFRYHIMEPLNDDRADILMGYLEELERRGPPPPPTASEPGRRGK